MMSFGLAFLFFIYCQTKVQKGGKLSTAIRGGLAINFKCVD
jgi:hypothetical protein